MRYDPSVFIGDREISLDKPTYFIADLASSHDGDLERAKALIWQAKEAGADCAKFQHFLAKDIVSDAGFKALGGQIAHQSSWKKSVYEVFETYQTPRDWTETLVEECRKANIVYMTTPYDFAAADQMEAHVPAYKIGSGDIGWTQFIEYVAQKAKPVLISTGAASMEDVERAMSVALKHNRQILLMQCNTNYTGSIDNFSYMNLKVLQAYALKWPGLCLGLSDHSPGHAAVLGAIAFGARAVEKHFTDDNSRDGPDHPFSMNPTTWRDMVDRARELETALGDGVKRVEINETDAHVVQRRAVRLARDLPAGHELSDDDLVMLRPLPRGALEPWEDYRARGRALRRAMTAGEALTPQDLD
ncbi:MAG: N-acetylneuraminate synthase family protein [Maricaulaceae bacterium]